MPTGGWSTQRAILVPHIAKPFSLPFLVIKRNYSKRLSLSDYKIIKTSRTSFIWFQPQFLHYYPPWRVKEVLNANELKAM